MMADYKGILIFNDWLDALKELSANDFKDVILMYAEYCLRDVPVSNNVDSMKKVLLTFMTSGYDRMISDKKKDAERKRLKKEDERNSVEIHGIPTDSTEIPITKQNITQHNITKHIDYVVPDVTTSSSKQKKFVPPSLEDVQAYCKERHSSVDPQKFFEFYQEGNWKDSKGNPVRNWKQKLITWESKENKKEESSSHQDDEWDDFMKAAFNKFLEG